MSWKKLFNIAIPSPRIRGEAAPVAAAQEASKGVFVTPQSLVTFPVATMVVGLITKVVTTLQPAWGKGHGVPLVASLFVGLIIYYIGISDPKANLSTRDKVIALFIALINTLYLFAVVAGIANNLLKG
jgi:hypothetical protein